MDANSTPSEHGLVIGRFIPPHGGHDFLLTEAFNLSAGNLTVMVMSRDDDAIPGDVRVEWLRHQHPGKNILLVKHGIPLGQIDAPTWQRWIDLINANLASPVTTIFSSETYGDEAARRMGIRHHLVDMSRNAVPVSGTKIRNDFEANKQYISDEVYQWMKANWKKPPAAPASPVPQP